MAKEQNNGRNWYAVVAAGLILAVVGWCVVVVANGSVIVYANKEKIAIIVECIDGIEDDVKETKDDVSIIRSDVKELLKRR